MNVKCLNRTLMTDQTCIDMGSISIQHIDNLVVTSCHFEPMKFSDNDFNILGISLPTSLDAAVSKRKSEFLAGRYLETLALANIGFDENRAPIWPQGTLGSISHSLNTAKSIVTKNQHYRFIGVDIEHWISPSDANLLVDNIVINDTEYTPLLKLMPFNQALTLIFSAKESLFKAIFKEVGHYFDFKAAKVSAIDFTQQQLTLTLTQHLSERMVSGRIFTCQFTQDDESVTTLVTA